LKSGRVILVTIPQSHQDLIKDEIKAYAILSTTMKDGTPQVTPIWFNAQDGFILINSVRGRVKDRNMRKSPQVALVILDPINPYRYVQIRGKVVEITTQGAEAHIHELSRKYTGQDFTIQPGDTRVKYKIMPEHVTPY
jgi:PPOX class probable F420-dependent enzyme